MKSSEKTSKYVDNVIGVDNLSNKIRFEKKYLDKEWVIHLLYEMSTGETVLTQKGLDFLDEVWGFKTIANALFEHEGGKGDFTDNFKSKEKIVEWLKNYQIQE